MLSVGPGDELARLRAPSVATGVVALPRPGLVTSDQAGLRRANLSRVLRHLLAHGPRSRATVAAEVGLTKATVGSLAADLIDRGLLNEGPRERAGTVGRPGRLLHVASGVVVGLGVEVSTTAVEVVAVDLAGPEALRVRTPVDAGAGPEVVVGAIADTLRQVLRTAHQNGWHVCGATVAVPGLVDVRHGVVVVAPNLGWRDLALVARLEGLLGWPDLPIEIDNDANLGALAEHACGAGVGISDLVYVAAWAGVGTGLVVDGRLVRGAVGFSGEIGHTPLGHPDRLCGCGRRGCLETDVGLGALVRAAAHGPDDEILHPALDIESLLQIICDRVDAGDEAAVAAVHEVAVALGRGAGVLINFVNPGALVLGGYLSALGPHLVPAVEAALADHTIAPAAGGCSVRASQLGLAAASIGGAIEALRRVLDDPTSVPATSASGSPGAPSAADPQLPRSEAS